MPPSPATMTTFSSNSPATTDILPGPGGFRPPRGWLRLIVSQAAISGGPVEGTPFGRYRLVELLGRGGMGDVWRAYDTVTDRVVAVKVLPAHLASDQTFQERFRREARAAAGLNNPHVVPIHDFGEMDVRLFV